MPKNCCDIRDTRFLISLPPTFRETDEFFCVKMSYNDVNVLLFMLYLLILAMRSPWSNADSLVHLPLRQQKDKLVGDKIK